MGKKVRLRPKMQCAAATHRRATPRMLGRRQPKRRRQSAGVSGTKWTYDELDYAQRFALMIFSGRMSYYRAMKTLSEAYGRTEEATRTKLKKMVKAIPVQ